MKYQVIFSTTTLSSTSSLTGSLNVVPVASIIHLPLQWPPVLLSAQGQDTELFVVTSEINSGDSSSAVVYWSAS